MNSHFKNISKELDLKPDLIPDNTPNTLDSIIDKKNDHKSMTIIQAFHAISKNAFNFKDVYTSEIDNTTID